MSLRVSVLGPAGSGPFSRGYACIGLLVALLHPTEAHATSSQVSAPRNLLSLHAGLEPTPFLGVSYERQGSGILQSEARSGASVDTALFTGLHLWRFEARRDEPLFATGIWQLEVQGATGFVLGQDAAGHYQAWNVRLGLRALLRLAPWSLGLGVAYLPSVLTHISFSSEARDTYKDRYPEDRASAGPKDATLWFASNRARAFLVASRFGDDWVFHGALGIEASLLAGTAWATLEQGQLPLWLQVSFGRRF